MQHQIRHWFFNINLICSQCMVKEIFPLDTYSSISCPSTSWTPLSDLAMSHALLSTWTQSTLILWKHLDEELIYSSHNVQIVVDKTAVKLMNHAWTHQLKVHDVDSAL